MDGGLDPVWAHDGSELFYVSANREMWVAQYETVSGFRVVGRELLFELPPAVIGGNIRWRSFDVSSDDQRFLMVRPYAAAQDEGSFSGIVLVQNFLEELKRLVPN
jgi:hypothetical protein